jgi:hypothetical protein
MLRSKTLLQLALLTVPTLHVQAPATQASVLILVLDGKTGEPIPDHRLLIFGGDSREKLHVHQMHFELTTDKQGQAVLDLSHRDVAFVQVWVDDMMLCQNKPNLQEFDIALIDRIGLSTPNTCGKINEPAKPKMVTIYARHPTVLERMKR